MKQLLEFAAHIIRLNARPIRVKVWCGVVVIAMQLAHARTVVGEPLHIAMSGDSLMNITNTGIDGWGELFPEYFLPSVQIDNDAVSGRSTKNIVTEGDWQTTLDREADYVFISFGHNDQKLYAGPKFSHPVDDPPNVTPGIYDLYRVNLRRMVDEVRATGGTPILLTPVARRVRIDDGMGGLKFNNDVPYPGEGVAGNNYSLFDYAVATRAVATEKSAAMIDLNQLTLDLYNQMLDDGEDITTLGPPGDDTHFTEDGARIIAGIVAGEIPTVLPGSDLAGALLVPEPSSCMLLGTLVPVMLSCRTRNRARWNLRYRTRTQ